jgi:hypothetical protein
MIINRKANHDRIFGKVSANQYAFKPYSVYTGSMFYWRDVLLLPLGDILCVQSNTCLHECDGLIPYQWFCHIYEMKPSNAISASLNDITGVYAHYVTQGNKTASCHLDSVIAEPI